MKNSLSKTLLCGVMASAFLLANCQKAPSRGVKAGSPGLTEKTQSLAKSVSCTSDYMKTYGETRKQQIKMDSLVKAITAESSDEEKANLVKEIDVLNRLAKNSEIAGAKLKAEACTYSMNGKTETVVLKDMITLSNSIGTKVEKATGAANDLSNRAQASLREKATASLAEGMELLVGKDLANALDTDLIKSSFFMGGALGTSEMGAAKKDKSKTLCYISMTSGKVEEGSTLTILTIKAEMDESLNRKTLTLNAQSTTGLNTITCLLGEGRDAAVLVRNAFGANLLSKKQVDAKAGVEDKVAVEDKAQAPITAVEEKEEVDAEAKTEVKSEAKVEVKITTPVAAKPATKEVSVDNTKAVSRTGTVTAAEAMAVAKKHQAELDQASKKEVQAAPAVSEQSKPVDLSNSLNRAVTEDKTITVSADASVKTVGVVSADATKAVSDQTKTEKSLLTRVVDSIKSLFAPDPSTTYDAMGDVSNF